MTQIEQSSNYKAAEGCFIVRKADGFIMGEDIDLGSADSIDNYEDKPYTEEERKAFYESISILVPREEEKHALIEKDKKNNKTEEE